jgi:hypothetical protein
MRRVREVADVSDTSSRAAGVRRRNHAHELDGGLGDEAVRLLARDEHGVARGERPVALFRPHDAASADDEHLG